MNFFTKLFQIKMVLEKNLNFEGMTRKIQMKPLKSDFKLIEKLEEYKRSLIYECVTGKREV